MKAFRRIFVLLLAVAGLAASESLERRCSRAEGETSIMIVVHAENAANPDDYQNADIKKIFLKETTTWADKTDILPVQIDGGSAEAEIFRKSVLKMTEKELAKYWADRRAEQGVEPPMSKDNSRGVFRIVSVKEKNAVGFIGGTFYESLSEDDKKKLKVLRTVS